MRRTLSKSSMCRCITATACYICASTQRAVPYCKHDNNVVKQVDAPIVSKVHKVIPDGVCVERLPCPQMYLHA